MIAFPKVNFLGLMAGQLTILKIELILRNMKPEAKNNA